MDVEDNELNVLKGAAQTIKQNNYPTILFESNHENKALFSYIINDLGYGNIIQVNGVSNMFLTEPPVKPDSKSYYESLGIRQWT